jgi:hypothetical protein
MSRYLNPYTDFGFKKLFGEEANLIREQLEQYRMRTNRDGLIFSEMRATLRFIYYFLEMWITLFHQKNYFWI